MCSRGSRRRVFELTFAPAGRVKCRSRTAAHRTSRIASEPFSSIVATHLHNLPPEYRFLSVKLLHLPIIKSGARVCKCVVHVSGTCFSENRVASGNSVGHEQSDDVPREVLGAHGIGGKTSAKVIFHLRSHPQLSRDILTLLSVETIHQHLCPARNAATEITNEVTIKYCAESFRTSRWRRT